jgi:hypothetical protein
MTLGIETVGHVLSPRVDAVHGHSIVFSASNGNAQADIASVKWPTP